MEHVATLMAMLRTAQVYGYSVHLRCTGNAYSVTLNVRGSAVALGIGSSWAEAGLDAIGDTEEWLRGIEVAA